MDEKQFAIIDKKLEVLIGLLAMNITKGETVQEQAELLRSLGLTQGEIARSLGKTTNNIKQTLHQSREKKKNKNEGK